MDWKLKEIIQLGSHVLPTPSFSHSWGSCNAKIIQTESNYEALAELTSCKSVPLIKYHIQTISKQPKRPKWTQLEDSLLFTMLAVYFWD